MVRGGPEILKLLQSVWQKVGALLTYVLKPSMKGPGVPKELLRLPTTGLQILRHQKREHR